MLLILVGIVVILANTEIYDHNIYVHYNTFIYVQL